MLRPSVDQQRTATDRIRDPSIAFAGLFTAVFDTGVGASSQPL
jgi:hypothetical protein